MTKFSVILYLFSLLTIQAETKKILFLGDSLTAGFGISKDKAFPALIQKKIDAKKLDYSIINAGLSGETTAGGARRIKWLLKQKVDILFVCLGGNDGLRGIQSKSSKGNLLKIISIAQKKGITVVLGGMLAAPNMGPDYAKEFKQIYIDIAKEKKIALVPFILKSVGGVRKMNQADGIHPNSLGHKKVAETIWPVLNKLLK